MTVATPIKYHGGKHYLAKRIVALMPARKVLFRGPMFAFSNFLQGTEIVLYKHNYASLDPVTVTIERGE